MKKRFLLIMLLLSIAAAVPAEETANSPKKTTIHIELDQMLSLKIGAEYRFRESWGIKGAAGFTFLGTVSYDLVGVHHFREREKPFQLNLEFGLPIAYFNIIENALVDWDPMIDDPYAGWGPGVSVVWGRRFRSGQLGLKTGVICVFEFQRDTGWRDPFILPEVAVEWVFSGKIP